MLFLKKEGLVLPPSTYGLSAPPTASQAFVAGEGPVRHKDLFWPSGLSYSEKRLARSYST